MKKKYISFVFLFLLSLGSTFAQYQYVTQWGGTIFGTGNGQFNNPSGVAVDSKGYIYVADGSNSRIQKFDNAGTYIKQYGSWDLLNGVGTIAVDGNGNMYVDDANSHIQKLDSSGNVIARWGGVGNGNGQFSLPMSVALDAKGNVYVTDGNRRIQKFNSSGIFIKKWGGVGNGNGLFSQITGIAVDPSGNVYVADGGNNRVQKFDTLGNFLSQWGKFGSANGEFSNIQTIAADNKGYIYVVEGGRIQKFDASGNYIVKWPLHNFSPTKAIAIDNNGFVYAAVTPNNVQVYSPLPIVTGFSPSSGLIGSTVTIKGQYFNKTTGVKFNGATANFTIVSDSIITAIVPSRADTGAISVTTSGTTNSSKDFIVLNPHTPKGISDNFNDNILSCQWATATNDYNLSEKNGVLKVKVHTISPNYSSFTLQLPQAVNLVKNPVLTFKAKTLTSAFPLRVDLADTNQVSSNATPVQNFVTNGSYTTFTFNFAKHFSQLYPTASALDSSAIKYIVFIVNPGSSANDSLYIEDLVLGKGGLSDGGVLNCVPVVSSFADTSGFPGDTIVIKGAKFSGATNVKFNGIASSAIFKVLNDSIIIAKIPDDAISGNVSVSTSYGSSLSQRIFTVNFGVLTAKNLTTAGNEEVQIYSANNELHLQIGGRLADHLEIINTNGQPVKILDNAGSGHIICPVDNLTKGLYLVRLNMGTEVKTSKIYVD